MAEANVLIVDDEKEFLETISERLINRGFQVDAAGNGLEALDKLDAKNYDAIVLDMMMPQMDGIETLKHIRASHPEMQVILLTGHATLQKGVEAVKLGAMDFLEKPAEIEALVAKIKEAKSNRLLLVEKQREEAVQEILVKYGV
jgi:DNA-binding NtrC family response regulator